MNRSTTFNADHPRVQRTGRFHVNTDGGLSCAWSGSQVTVHFEGTDIDVTIHDHARDEERNFLAVFVDDAPPVKLSLKPGNSTYPLAENLSPGGHTIRIFKQTEAYVGRFTLERFSITNGTILPPPPKAERRIEFIGDSITCGNGNEGTHQEEPFKPSTENHFLSYGQLTARNLGAEAHVVAWSGEGIFRNAMGDTIRPLPMLFGQVLPPLAAPLWDFSNWIPHVVVINLGTNDFFSGTPDREAFIEAYLQLLQTIGHHYRSPDIFFCIGPMVPEDVISTFRDYFQEVQVRAKAIGICSLNQVDFEPLRSDEYGADWHPNLAAHRRMANTLTEAIRPVTDW